MSAQQSHAMRNGLRRQFNFIQIICVIVSGIQYAEESSQNENEIFVHATEPGKRSCSRVTRDPRGARLRDAALQVSSRSRESQQLLPVTNRYKRDSRETLDSRHDCLTVAKEC
jgi:hypothetical protein